MSLNKAIRMIDPIVFLDNVDSSQKYWSDIHLHKFEDVFISRKTLVEKDKGILTPVSNIHKVGEASPREFDDTILFLYHENVDFLANAPEYNTAHIHEIQPEEIMTRLFGYTSDCLRSHRHDDTLELRVNRLFR